MTLTPHPIAAERSLSVPAKPLPETEHQPVANDTARSSPARLWDRIASWLRDVFGTIEWTLGDFCEFCRDVHPCGTRCPRQVSASCDVCGTVLLTASLTCPAPRSTKRNHFISKSSIHLTTEAEWQRSHLRLCCERENS